MGSITNLPRFDQLRKVHIIGVCGTLMAPFAAFLMRKGIEVTGSDQNIYPPMSDLLKNAGIKLFAGYRAENLLEMKSRPDLVVIGNVISASNPEARAAIDGGYAYTSLPAAMEALLLPQTRNLVVSGTHGKTTTSSMLAHVLAESNRNPNYFIGGVSLDLPFSFNVSGIDRGRFFVLEGDEYDTAFWDKVPKFNHYLPDHVILTSVEYDHADIYPDFDSVLRAFSGLLSRIRASGRLIACYDYPAIRDLVRNATLAQGVEVVSYAGAPGPDIRFAPGKIESRDGETWFEVLEHGRVVDELAIRIPGKHNVMNALAVWVECRSISLSSEEVRNALAKFRGVKRRQEVRGEVKGVMVIDDFAHHPTAVRETLQALKMRYPGRRLVAVFEPRSASSRRKVFQKDYGVAFDVADAVFIAKPYDQSKIREDEQFSSQQLVADLIHNGRKAELLEGGDAGCAQLGAATRSGDLVAVLSNGSFDGLIVKLLAYLETQGR